MVFQYTYDATIKPLATPIRVPIGNGVFGTLAERDVAAHIASTYHDAAYTFEPHLIDAHLMGASRCL